MMLNDAEKMWLLQLKTCFSNFILFDLQNPSLEFLHPVTNQPGMGVALDEFSLTHSIFTKMPGVFYGFLWPKSSFTQPQRDKGGGLIEGVNLESLGADLNDPFFPSMGNSQMKSQMK